MRRNVCSALAAGAAMAALFAPAAAGDGVGEFYKGKTVNVTVYGSNPWNSWLAQQCQSQY